MPARDDSENARDDMENRFSDHYRGCFSDSPDMSGEGVAVNTRQDGGPKKFSYAAAASNKNLKTAKNMETEAQRRLRHFYIRGLSDNIQETDVILALEKCFGIKAENIFEALGIDNRRFRGKRSLEILLKQKSYKDVLMKEGIIIKDEKYGPFYKEKDSFFIPRRTKPSTRAYIPFLPIWMEAEEVEEILDDHYIEFEGVKPRYSKEAPYRRTFGWNVGCIRPGSARPHYLNFRDVNYKILYFHLNNYTGKYEIELEDERETNKEDGAANQEVSEPQDEQLEGSELQKVAANQDQKDQQLNINEETPNHPEPSKSSETIQEQQQEMEIMQETLSRKRGKTPSLVSNDNIRSKKSAKIEGLKPHHTKKNKDIINQSTVEVPVAPSEDISQPSFIIGPITNNTENELTITLKSALEHPPTSLTAFTEDNGTYYTLGFDTQEQMKVARKILLKDRTILDTGFQIFYDINSVRMLINVQSPQK